MSKYVLLFHGDGVESAEVAAVTAGDALVGDDVVWAFWCAHDGIGGTLFGTEGASFALFGVDGEVDEFGAGAGGAFSFVDVCVVFVSEPS